MPGLLMGIWHALSPENLLFGTIGCILGTLVGVLPGLGPSSALAILLSLVVKLPPAPAIIMMAGVYYGAQYGGSTTSILLNIPGEASAVVTCFDGYPMAKQGRAGPALAISAIGSFVGGTISISLMAITGPILANFAFYFRSPDYCALMFFSLIALAVLSSESLLKGFLTVLLGMLLATIGCSLSGIPVFTFGSTMMMSGLELVSVVIGLFGISEILIGLDEKIVTVASEKLGKLMPTLQELRNCVGCMLRSTGSAFFLGLLPGMIPAITSFIAYDVEKRVSKNRHNFGKGAIEGVCAPETANNASVQAGFIPLFAFGIPTGASLAMLLAALIIFGLEPGPYLFTKKMDLVWTIIGSMYVGNVLLVILNLPLVGLWARIAYVPYRLLAPLILGICFVGAYVTRNNILDVGIAMLFGIIGYLGKKFDWPLPPLILGFILGPKFEGYLRTSLTMSGGSLDIFFKSPISMGFILLTFLLICLRIYILRTGKKARIILKDEE